ncbi:MAG TPA: phosphoglycerate dehydrogenase [Planctomycetota bacterium]|nr:phosphoglycerate dehydrogenase [Planctomycetota bacterium]
MKVLVSDKLAQEGLDILEAAKGIEVVNRPGLSVDELKKAVADVEGIVIRSATKLTADVLAEAKKLKAVARAGAGVDNVDLEAASRRGVIVMNTPGKNSVSAAEHAIGMLFALARNIPAADASMKQGQWEKKKYTGTELTGKVLGVVGLGRIGSEVARRALGLRMKVLGLDPFLDTDRARALGIEMTDSLETLMKTCDYVSVHASLTDKTRGMIGKAQLSGARAGIGIVNCARGGIVDEEALLEALDSGKVSGAAVDVWTSEPCTDWRLAKHPKVVATPHLGASTEEAQISVAVAAAEQMVDALVAGNVRFAVNFPAIDPDEMVVLKPYLTLGERLGAIAAQLCEGAVKEVTVTYAGEVASHKTEPVDVAVAVGLLSPYVEDVNMVNARLLLAERGVVMNVTRTSAEGDFVTTVSVVVRSGDETHTVVGTLFGKSRPRLVMVDGFALEVEPAGTILFIHNKDVPGVIGEVGRILGDHGINIANMNNGRRSAGGDALTVVSVDTKPDEKVIAALTAASGLTAVKLVGLD